MSEISILQMAHDLVLLMAWGLLHYIQDVILHNLASKINSTTAASWLVNKPFREINYLTDFMSSRNLLKHCAYAYVTAKEERNQSSI